MLVGSVLEPTNILMIRSKMKTKLYWCLILVAMVCCTDKHSGYFSERHEVISLPKDSIVLDSELFLLSDTVSYMASIHCVDDYLVAECSDNKDTVFSVYMEDGTLASRFGHVGRSKNEFTSGMRINGQFDNGCFFVNDVNLSVLKAVNLKSSVDSSVCIVDKVIVTGGRVMNAYYINDSTIIYEQETKDNYQINRVNTKTGSILDKYDLYVPHENAYGAYYSKMRINPTKERFVSAMCFLNQVNFMNIDGTGRKSVSLYTDAEICENRQRQRAYYCDVTSNSERVYTLYMNQLLQNESYRIPKPMEIHVFDWNGVFQGKLIVHEYLVNITVDDKNKLLYGRDIDGNVYKYKIEETF